MLRRKKVKDSDVNATETAPDTGMVAESESEGNVDIEEASEKGSNQEMDALHKELAESKDKYLRLAAEFDNFRKRTLREKSEMIQSAGESMLRDILPIVDDFERGLQVSLEAEDVSAVRTGMELIYNKLNDFLTNQGVKEIPAVNEIFDVDVHEAVANVPVPSDDMKGKIIDVLLKGYTLYDKVIRFPKVVVGE